MEHIVKGKLAYVQDDQLIINTLPEIADNDNIVTIAHIGNARIGKSTFINTLISYFYNTSCHVAETQNNLEHCTIGIDYIICKNLYTTYIIYDCQGLNYNDSKFDDKFLTIIHQISNTVVYHCNGIIDNSVLNNLTPMCVVLNNLRDKQNNFPVLVFRIKDYVLDSDPGEFEDILLNNKEDQYDQVRGAIIELFLNCEIFHTEILSKAIIKKATNHEYLELLKNNYNFSETIQEILNLKRFKEFNIRDINKMLDSMNREFNNACIPTFKDYDICSLIFEKEFQEFWKEYKVEIETMLKDIKPSKYQHENDKCDKVEQRIKSIVDMCIEKFIAIDHQILNDKCHEQVSDYLKKIDELRDKNYCSANQYFEEEVKRSLIMQIKDIIPKYITCVTSWTEISNNLKECLAQVCEQTDGLNHKALKQFKDDSNRYIDCCQTNFNEVLLKLTEKRSELLNAIMIKLSNLKKDVYSIIEIFDFTGQEFYRCARLQLILVDKIVLEYIVKTIKEVDYFNTYYRTSHDPKYILEYQKKPIPDSDVYDNNTVYRYIPHDIRKEMYSEICIIKKMFTENYPIKILEFVRKNRTISYENSSKKLLLDYTSWVTIRIPEKYYVAFTFYNEHRNQFQFKYDETTKCYKFTSMTEIVINMLCDMFRIINIECVSEYLLINLTYAPLNKSDFQEWFIHEKKPPNGNYVYLCFSENASNDVLFRKLTDKIFSEIYH